MDKLVAILLANHILKIGTAAAVGALTGFLIYLWLLLARAL